MKIVFMGTPVFAVPALQALAKSEHKLLAVVTGEDKKAGRGKILAPTPIGTLAKTLQVPVIKPHSLKDNVLYDQLRQLQADLFVVIAFRILPKNLFSLPRLGSINIHGSLLPKYRGAAPINWALINGEKETGLSAFFLKTKVDTGDVINQTRTAIDENENFDQLYERLSQIAAPFLLETLTMIASGTTRPLPQNEVDASMAPKLTPFDAFIDFGFPARHVVNFIRGMATKPGAYSYFRQKKIKIIAAKTAEPDETLSNPTKVGSIVQIKKKLLVCCANSVIEITRLIPEGKKEMDGISFINGFKPELGELFGEAPHKEF